MALVFCDGFDHLATYVTDRVEWGASDDIDGDNQLWYKWEQGYLLGNPEIWHYPSTQRRPAPSSWPIGHLVFASTYYQAWIYRHFNEEHYDTLIFGFAFMGIPGFSQPNSPIIVFYDYDGNAIVQSYPIDGTGRVRVSLYEGKQETPNDNYDLIATYYSDTNVTQERTWYHFDCKIVFSKTTGGSVQARINETDVINETGIRTYSASGDSRGDMSFTQIQISKGLHNTFYMDDLYILDGEGSVANDLIGDVRVDTIYPNGAGFYTNFEPEPSSNANWENVEPRIYARYQYPDLWTYPPLRSFLYNGTGANFATYNKAEDTLRETYNLESLSVLDKPIYGLQTNSIFRKTDAGKKQVEQTIRVSSTDYDSGRVIDVPDWSKNYTYPVTVNPFTTNAWTEAEIAALESGIKIVT